MRRGAATDGSCQIRAARGRPGAGKGTPGRGNPGGEGQFGSSSARLWPRLSPRSCEPSVPSPPRAPKALGQRPTPAGRAPASTVSCGSGRPDAFPHGRGNAMRFLLRPTVAEAIAEVMRDDSPHPRRGPPRLSASACPAHGRRSAPARSGAGLCGEGGSGHPDTLLHGRGNAMRFLLRPTVAEAIAEVMRAVRPIPDEGPKGPRPAPDPRREGAGLCS